MAKAGESYWTLEDGALHIQLCKAEEGATWASAIAGAGAALAGLRRRWALPAAAMACT